MNEPEELVGGEEKRKLDKLDYVYPQIRRFRSVTTKESHSRRVKQQQCRWGIDWEQRSVGIHFSL